GRSREGVDGADPLDKSQGGRVAGEQQMIAVIDAAAEFGIEKRPAAAAGMLAGFVERDAMSVGDQRHGGGETGDSGADDMHPARRTHTRPWRNTSRSLCSFDSETRLLGSRQPSRSKTSSRAR